MSRLHDQGIEVVPISGGMRYILPARKGKGIRTLGWVVAGVGGFMTAFMIFWMSGPFLGFLHEKGPGRWFNLAFAMSGMFGLVPGVALLAGGLGLAAGWSRCVIRVTADKIRVTERLGVIWWSWTRKTADLTNLLPCAPEPASSPETNSLSQVSHVINTIQAVGVEGKQGLTIGAAYPCSLLQALEAELSARTGLRLERNDDFEEEDEPEEQVDVAAETSQAAERPPQTDIVLQNLPDGVGLSVPPVGLWRGTKGLFLVAIIWEAMVSVMILITILSLTKEGFKADENPVLPFVFFGVFAVIGMIMLLIAINVGRRRALLAVSSGVLTIRQLGPFGTKEQRFACGQVAAVQMGPSGIAVNDKPLMELQIFPASGKKLGILTQRTEEELLWIAAVVRRELKLKPNPPT